MGLGEDLHWPIGLAPFDSVGPGLGKRAAMRLLAWGSREAAAYRDAGDVAAKDRGK